MEMLVPTARDMVRMLVRDYPDIDVNVRALAWRCWRCGKTSPAFGLVHVDDCLDPVHVVDAASDLGLEYVRDLLTMIGSPLASTIKLRSSTTAGYSYVSSGCAHCDALFGAALIREQLIEIIAADAVETMPLILRVSRPELEMHLLNNTVPAMFC